MLDNQSEIVHQVKHRLRAVSQACRAYQMTIIYYLLRIFSVIHAIHDIENLFESNQKNDIEKQNRFAAMFGVEWLL